jgi:hypothetical protein
MSRSTLTSKGQTTIRKDVRKPFTLPLENPLEYVIDEEWSSAGAGGDDRSRDNERPETITIGTNELIGTDPSKLPPALAGLMTGWWKKGAIPPKWDGKTAAPIVEHLERVLARK